ncbi:MAG: helix-turn-helix domain-containing protein [Bacteriovoracaceae bacterium]|jgi:predicted DNA-binding transcriptional regulator AlpA|nr:helix-turn-helix domain-containing protein [Bacteriovoracaceae bacterium]
MNKDRFTGVDYKRNFEVYKRVQSFEEESLRLSELFDKRIWRINDVALFLQCTVGTIYNKTSKDEIPHIKKGNTLYFRPEAIESWVMEGNL